MTTVSEIYRYLDAHLPRTLSAEWDNDGLMVCPNPDAPVKKIVTALDVTPAVIAYAEECSAELIISHHPLIFGGIRHMDGADGVSRKVMRLIENGIAVMSFHTRLDAAKGGINDILAALFGLADITPFGPDGEEAGRFGMLPAATDFDTFCRLVRDTLSAPSVYAAKGVDTVSRVAVLGGAGKDYITPALRAGADILVTGEVGYNHMLDAAENGLSVVAAGHFHTEIPFSAFFVRILEEAFPEIRLCRCPTGCELRYF